MSGHARIVHLESSGNRWTQTLEQFLDLARKASRDFDYERALRHLSTMEELWDSKGMPASCLELRYELHSEKGRAFSKLGRYHEAVAEYQKLLQYCQDKKLLTKRTEVFLEIGQLLAKTGEHDRALGYVHRALSGYRRLNDSLGICKSLRNLGVIYIELGEFEDAETAYEEAIRIAQTNQLHLLYADLHNNLGTIKNIKGAWQAALVSYKTASAVYAEEGEIRKSAYTLNNIGITYLEQERFDRARENFLSAMQVAGIVKDESLLLILNINMTDLSLKTSVFTDAKNYCAASHSYLETKRLRNSQLVETKKLAGKIAVYEGEYETAREHFNEALGLCEELGLQYLEAEVLFEKGNLLLAMGQHMEALRVLEEAIRLFHQVDAAGRVKKTERLIDSIEELYLKVFEAMAHEVDQKDPYTKGHSDRVANLSLFIARELGLADHDIKAVVAGGLLHDIGKLKTPNDILKKRGRLTAEEYDEIKKHPEAGLQILSGIRLPWDISPFIQYHHEKFDGTGYPAGLNGELIPLGARIICAADVFDALTSERPYREAHSPSRALEVMKVEMKSSFDPIVMDTLVQLIESGQADHIVNRHTDRDEMYQIWAQCRFNPSEDSDAQRRSTSPVTV